MGMATLSRPVETGRECHAADRSSHSDEALARFVGAEGRPLMWCAWEGAVFIHYEVDPELLRPHVPFELDCFDGKAYVSLVAFRLSDLRVGTRGWLGKLLGWPLATHDFLNVRTYVRHGGEGGIYFIREWVSRRLAVALGPAAYALPYRLGQIKYQNLPGEFFPDAGTTLVGEVEAEGERLAYSASLAEGPDLRVCPPGTLDEFLMERYVAFTGTGRRMRTFQVWHEPWPYAAVDVETGEDGLLRRMGDWARDAKKSHATWSPGVYGVWVGRPRRIASEREDGNGLKWLGMALLPAAAFVCKGLLPAWVFMWAMAYAIFLGCKWLTWWDARGGARTGVVRHLAYFFAWPGFDATTFLSRSLRRARVPAADWFVAVAKTACGAALLWAAARWAAHVHPTAGGWVAMLGLVFLLHFGLFHLIALAWRSAGVNVRPIMRSPAIAGSLSEFWGRRWNLPFAALSNTYLFRPLTRRFGPEAATYATFALSGLVHELVISLPAGAGWGLPTVYFLLQGAGVLLERSPLGDMLGLRDGVNGRLFTAVLTLAPLYFLFHPPFVANVILPFVRVIRAM